MTFYGIYKITNLLNGKMYIGKHKTSNLDDGYMGSGIVINQALEKYGKENFRKEWLMFCEDKEEMNYMERVFVDQTWVDRSDTYNLKLGGEGGLNYVTQEVRKKMSEAAKRRKPSFLGHKHSEETKQKISEFHKGNTWHLGCRHTEEAKQKMSIAHKGKCLSRQTRYNLSKAFRLLHWYNNGKINVRTKECPEGFVAGRINYTRRAKNVVATYN